MKIMAKEVYFLPAATLGAVRSTGAKVWSVSVLDFGGGGEVL